MKRLFGTTILLVAVSISLALVWPGRLRATSITDNTEVAWQSRDDEHMIEIFTVGGRPLNTNSDYKVKVLINHGYAVGYCEERRNPLWAVYKASKMVSGTDAERFDRPQFFPRDLRATPAVDGRTFGGGMDRGHMVPNAAIGTQYGTLAQAETFFMTNMCPQADDLNQGPWARLEKWILDAAKSRKHVYVIAGPVFGDAPSVVTNGSERAIQVPESFYMILIDTDREWTTNPTVKLMAYLFPQDADRTADFTDRTKFGTSVNDIEAKTGLDFFPVFESAISNWDAKEVAVEGTHWVTP